MTPDWEAILAYAQRYPSPHNSQPIKVRIDDSTLHLYYDLDRGLPAEPFGIPFGSVCAGVFVESVAIAANAMDFRVIEDLNYTPFDFSSPQRLHPLGTLTLEPGRDRSDDLDADLMLRRQTSRLPYEPRRVPDSVVAAAAGQAARGGHTLRSVDDPKTVEQIIAVNQRTLFYDLDNPDVRHEIQGYLRYSETEARRTGDGLSARCLALPGPIMRVVMGNYWIWRTPVLGHALKAIYLRSMRGVTQVAWLKGPFADERDYTQAGRSFFRMWLEFTRHGVYLHPFGSVITNPKSHRELISLVNEHEDGEMVWMLFRFGYSRRPSPSHRLALSEMEVPA